MDIGGLIDLQVTVLSMELASPTLPPGKTIALDLQNPTALADAKKVPITIKEGVEYKFVFLTHIPRRSYQF